MCRGSRPADLANFGCPEDCVAAVLESSRQASLLKQALQSCEIFPVKSADEAVGTVPANPQLAPQATSDQLDIARGGQQVLVDDGGLLSGVNDEDKALGGDREKPCAVIHVGHKELLDPFFLMELNSPTLQQLDAAQRRFVRRGDQARKQRSER